MTTTIPDHYADSMIESTPNCITVRVWEIPVRLVHWTLFFCVIVLSITGFYIGNPWWEPSGDTGFVMGNMRAVHIGAAWVFIVAIVARIIWAFMGNRWSRWDQFIPVRKERRVWLRRTLAYYLFLRREPPPAAGHNPLAGLTYTVLFLMFTFQIFSGLALDALETSRGFMWAISSWIFSIFSVQTVRLLHHLVMWLTIAFVIHHVYSAVMVDTEEKSGLVSSILTGYKRIPLDRL